MIEYLVFGIAGVAVLAVIGIFVILFMLRRVVPTNMVHIVQSSKATTSFGKGKDSGNTYYAWPSWVPKIGVSILQFPESIFQVSLKDYEAYDSARLPFVVDVVAFFRIKESETAAQRVPSFEELHRQLDSVLKGAVRRVLATNTLEHIMEARAALGRQFTEEVDAQILEWGVITVKTIEFMDLRDSSHSKVIANIMAKEQSRIDRESRVAIAGNTRQAENAEIESRRDIEMQKQEAQQQVGIRTAEKDQAVGLAKEKSSQQVQEQSALTIAKTMEVKRVEFEKSAEIDRTVAITNADAAAQVQVRQAEALAKATRARAEGESAAVSVKAEGDLAATLKEAEGIAAKGKAHAEAETALLRAPVTAQIELATEIGDNKGYQEYLITVERVRASQAVGVKMAEAIAAADIKVIANGGADGGGNVMNGVASIGDMFGTKGGTSLTGMLTALSQTPVGAAVIDKFTKEKK